MLLAVVMETAGIAIVLYTLREVFRDIFHPTRSGTLSDLLGRAASKMFRRTRFRAAAGPVALVAVIFVWVTSSAVGFAFTYYPLFPNQLSPASATSSILERALHSLYMSIGSLGTFQIFDVWVRSSWIRVIVALEGLVGISMITASVSWLVLIYPALERTRFLAKRAFVLARAGETSRLARVENENLIAAMADRVIQARIDLVLFPILMHFYPIDQNETLAHALPHLQRISDQCMGVECSPALQFAASQLHEALIDFSRMLCDRVLESDPEDLTATFRAFAALDE